MLNFFTIENHWRAFALTILPLVISSAWADEVNMYVSNDTNTTNNSKTGTSSAYATHAANQCIAPNTVSSEVLVNLALRCSASLQAKVSRWDAQKHLSQVAGRLDDPKLLTGAAPKTFDNEQFDPGVLVELSQALPWPGVRSLERKASLAQAEIWEEQVNKDEVSLAFQVRQYFFKWQYHQRLFELNKAQQVLWEEFIGIVRTKYSVGTARKSAVLQALHEHHLLLQEAIELRAAIERDKSQITRFVNLPAEAFAALESPSKNVNNTSLTLVQSSWEPQNIEKLFNAMISDINNQPAMRQLSAKKQHKNYQIKLAEKDRYPNFTASARYNSVLVNEEQRWMVGLGINIPLNFGKRTHRENALKAETMAIRYEQQDVQIKLREKLKQSFSLWKQAYDIKQLYQSEFLPLAQENVIAARDEYQSGSNDFLTLLTAERQVLNTQRKAEQAEYDIQIQLASLIASAGWVSLPSATDLSAKDLSATSTKSPHTYPPRPTKPKGFKTLSNEVGHHE